MNFSGHYLFLAERDLIWRALNNADALKQAIPGCLQLSWVGDNHLEMVIKVNLGIASPKFSGDLHLSDVQPARAYTLAGSGRGTLLGMAKGVAHIQLSDHPQGTEMTMSASGEASSAIMSLGQKLLGSAAQSVIDRFFERFAAAINVEVQTLDPNQPTS